MGDIKPTVLCVNHRDKQCGVHQFFKRLTEPLLKSQNFDVYYIDPGDVSEFDYWLAQINPSIILFNYYTGATMPWLTPQKVSALKARAKCLCVFHEVNIDHMGFDLIFHQDPTNTDERFVNLARPIPTFKSFYDDNDTPMIGSFGFGLGGKGFTRLTALVSQQFERAHIRINIPFAKFGDENGQGARDWAKSARDCLTNENVTLEVTHDFMDEPQLLDWLAHNDINCFLYDENYGRGISGTLDYALAVRRPIAITKSWQFKHIWHYDDSFLVENHQIPHILDRGVSHLEKFHHIWGDTAVRESFEKGFNRFV